MRVEDGAPTRRMLDTNVLSRLIRDPTGPVGQRIATLGDAAIFTSIVVACELRYGAARRGSAALTKRVDDVLASVEVAALEPGVDRRYAELRARLESRGELIGAHDMLIAAHALACDATLVTDNVEEFRRVPKLRVENWLRPAR